MNYKNLFNIIVATICICNININASSDLKINGISDNLSVNSEQMELLFQPDDNNSYISLYENTSKKLTLNCGYIELHVKTNNSNNISYNLNNNSNNSAIVTINSQKVTTNYKKQETNLYNSVKNTLISIVLIPTAVYNNIVSTLVHIANSNIPSIETTMNELNNVSKSMINISFDNTVPSIVDLVKTLFNKTINISTTAFGGIKGYIVRKIWG